MATNELPRRLIGEEVMSNTTTNGLMQVTIRYGMLHLPAGPNEVAAAFRDVARLLREFADGIDKVNAAAAREGKGTCEA